VIVVNWNGRSYLEKCLSSLAAQTYPAFEIIVVDNGSIDGSATWVSEKYPEIRLIVNPDNRGFAVANNQGIALGRGAYLALLNNDAWAEPDWLMELVAAVKADPQLGMAASKMMFVNQPAVINSTGICVDRSGISWDRSGGREAGSTDCEPAFVFGPCAGAALYRRELFETIGSFDEDFFAYLEDVDLAWRAQWRGWKAIYVPSARVYHVHSATGHEGSSLKTYLLARNKIQLLVKNYPMPELMLFLPAVVGYEMLSLTMALWRRRDLSPVKGRWAGLRLFWRALKKRQMSLSKPHVSNREMLKLLSPVAWPWQIYRRYEHLGS
jgi:GT2 family glycosyltransferase